MSTMDRQNRKSHPRSNGCLPDSRAPHGYLFASETRALVAQKPHIVCFAQHILRRLSTGLRGPHAPHAVVPGNLGQFLSTTAALLPRSCGKCAAGKWSACTAVLTPLPATALKQSCGIDRLITAATAPTVEGYGCNEVVSSSLDC